MLIRSVFTQRWQNFVAKRVRMQCLTTFSVLASKMNKATVHDKARLDMLFA